MEHTSLLYSLDTLDKAVELVYSLLDSYSVITFTGGLGAGKTTLIKQVLIKCGVKDQITSPTFTYVVSYTNAAGKTFYHYDLYRITEQAEFFRAGLDEFLYQPNSWSFIEWPEVIMPLLNRNACHISLEYYSQDKRLLSYRA